MTNYLEAVVNTMFIIGAATLFARFILPPRLTKATRYAVTLRNKEGGFVALCVKKRRGTWTFVDVRLTPTNSGGPVAAAPGMLHVPFGNILYYQELTEVANVPE